MHIEFSKIKNRLKELRISKAELCRRVSISTVAYWKWEKGINPPLESKFRQIAKELNLKINEISDLPPDPQVSQLSIEDEISSLAFLDEENTTRIKEEKLLVSILRTHRKEQRSASLLINAMLNASPIYIYVKDVNLRYIAANKKFRILTGIDEKNNIVGLKDCDFLPIKDGKTNNNEDYNVLSSGKEIDGIESYLPGSRKKIACLVYKKLIYDNKKKILGLIGMFVDISIRKREQAINEVLKKALDKSQAMIFLKIKSPRKIIYVSKNVKDILGYSTKEFYVNQDFWYERCLHSSEKQSFFEYNQSGDWPREYTCKLVKSSGELAIVHGIGYHNESFSICIEEDITSSYVSKIKSNLLYECFGKSRFGVYAICKNKEDLLINSSYFRTSYSNLNNRSNEIIYLTPSSFKSIYGHPVEMFEGKEGMNFWLSCIHPDDRKKEQEYIAQNRWPDKRTFRIIKPDKSIRIIEAQLIRGDENYDYNIETDITNTISYALNFIKENISRYGDQETIKKVKDNSLIFK